MPVHLAIVFLFRLCTGTLTWRVKVDYVPNSDKMGDFSKYKQRWLLWHDNKDCFQKNTGKALKK